MRIAYLGSLSLSDLEFPLLHSMQKRKDVEIVYYLPVMGKRSAAALININRVKKIDGIIKASEYDEFLQYKDYINLDKVFLINNYHNQRWHWKSWWIWITLLRHIKSQEVDVFHFVWPFANQRKLLYLLKKPRVMTVHDPLPHSSQISHKSEADRLLSFIAADKLILLNKIQIKDFCLKYNINESKIHLSHLGSYDCINFLGKKQEQDASPYILFFGQIQDHKGVDVLLTAMTKVHEAVPTLKCVIAGKGFFSFNIAPFQKLDYIDIRNYFIPIKELAGLLNGCLFAVCPYKDATQSGVVQTAFSAGVPLIVSNVGSLPESVKDGVMGIVVPPCDSDALAVAIVKLAKDKLLQQSFRNNIESNWKKDMSWDKIVDGYVNVYQILMDKK